VWLFFCAVAQTTATSAGGAGHCRASAANFSNRFGSYFRAICTANASSAKIGTNKNEMPPMKRKYLLILSVVACSAATLLAQTPAWQPAPGHITLHLWPNGAPDAPANPAPEVDTTTPKEPLIAGKLLVRLGHVSDPTLTLYAPKENNTGTAVVVFPGGGYQILAIDLEGTEVCDWLNSIGVNCILLKYRVPNSGPYPKSPAALEDAQRALGMVREHASEWHIDPNRIGVLGFSAGGPPGRCAEHALRDTDLSCRGCRRPAELPP